MGLIEMAGNLAGGVLGSGIDAVSSVLADQWIDFILCDSLNENTLMVPGKKPQQKTANTKGTENIITNGSKINVADGQCMLIIENGMVADFCAKPGQYTYNNQIAPSLFTGGLSGLADSFREVGKRFVAGGAATDQQLVYFVNIKEIINNKIGWGKIPFRHYDPEFDKSIVVQVQGFGMYTFKITDPLLFYKNVAGNVSAAYTKETLLATMKAEVMSALNPALGKIAQTKIPYDELTMYPEQLGTYINETVKPRWGAMRGIEIMSFAVESITVDEASAKKIEQLQETAIHTDAGMAAARLVTAQANAMEAAANNAGGATVGLMGVGMVQGAGGANAAADLFKMANDNKAQRQAVATVAVAPAPTAAPQQVAPVSATSGDSWTCACGAVNTKKFCADCGATKPEPVGWTCTCGAFNTKKFCADCGKTQQIKVVCPKCGWENDNPDKTPKFCPECGEGL